MSISEEKLREKFIEHVNILRNELIIRFDKGRLKYGNDITKIDYKKEIKEEEHDISIYGIMQDISNEITQSND